MCQDYYNFRNSCSEWAFMVVLLHICLTNDIVLSDLVSELKGVSQEYAP